MRQSGSEITYWHILLHLDNTFRGRYRDGPHGTCFLRVSGIQRYGVLLKINRKGVTLYLRFARSHWNFLSGPTLTATQFFNVLLFCKIRKLEFQNL